MSDSLNNENKLGKNDPRQYRLGKAPSRIDARTFKFAPLLRPRLPLPPKSWSFDADHPGVPTPMFKNSDLGDCVIAGRAHQYMRFKLLERGMIIRPTDEEVVREYFDETGGGDTGLVVLDSLKLWRNRGWSVGGENDKILSFASIDWRNRSEVMYAMIARVGVQIGASLPIDAANQIRNGEPWEVTSGNDSTPGSWGGHLFIVEAYDENGLTAITWGDRQRLSWDWLAKYCDEMYAVWDASESHDPEIVTPPVVDPPRPRPPQTDEPHEPQPGADVVVQIKPGEWNHDRVADFFNTLRPDNGTLIEAHAEDSPDGTTSDVEGWRVDTMLVSVYYNPDTGIVSGVTRTLGAF